MKQSKRRQWATNKWRKRVQKSDDCVEEEKKKVRTTIATVLTATPEVAKGKQGQRS
jgi:hypothetical protein